MGWLAGGGGLWVDENGFVGGWRGICWWVFDLDIFQGAFIKISIQCYNLKTIMYEIFHNSYNTSFKSSLPPSP